MALVGNLKDLKLPSLIQLNCMEKNTAKMTIEQGPKFGFLYFEGGQIVHAEFEPDMGEAALFKLLALYSGNFKVESGIRSPAKTITKNWNNLLLDAMHQLDDQDEGHTRKYDHLFERLFTVKGVQKVTVYYDEGTTIASSDEDSGRSNLYAFVQIQSGKVGNALNLEFPGFVSILASGKKYIFTKYKELGVVVEMDQKTKLDIVLPLLKQAVG